MRVALTGAIIMAALAWPAAAPAGDLQVTDSAGNAVELRKAYVNYGVTRYVVGGDRYDNEHDGLRVLQGEATVTVKWSRIKELVIEYVRSRYDEKEKKRYPDELKGEITLDSGKTVSAKLVEGRLKGQSELGDYEIDLKRVRSIFPLAEGEGKAP